MIMSISGEGKLKCFHLRLGQAHNLKTINLSPYGWLVWGKVKAKIETASFKIPCTIRITNKQWTIIV